MPVETHIKEESDKRYKNIVPWLSSILSNIVFILPKTLFTLTNSIFTLQDETRRHMFFIYFSNKMEKPPNLNERHTCATKDYG